MVPHDVGSPSETPFHVLNAYNFQDVSRWKDLGPKFILQVYRDYIFLLRQDGNKKDNKHQGKTFVQDLYPILVHVMDYMMSFDLDHDGMIENSGFPDQTYDIWIAKGIHAYCGGLWISACEAIAAIAKDIMQDVLVHEKYQSIARKGREVYIRTLYNGTYLNYDSSTSDHSKSIMADMLAGQWYAHCCQLPAVLPADQALSCLRTIYANNVIKFGKGEFIGAVNGMLPNGQVDVSCLQSREVWTGTTYALASVMMYEGLRSNSKTDREELLSMAFNTARGIHDGGWQKFGYWFATPEGWESNGNYRSLGYMRALCIWSMQYAVHDCEPRTSSHP